MIKVKAIKDGWSHEDLINPLGNNTLQDIMDKDHSTMNTKPIDMVDNLVVTNKPPPCAYRPSSQHNFEPPHSQAPFHHSPPYDPHLPQFQSNYTQIPPLPHVPRPNPSPRESEVRLKETVDQLQTTLHQLEQAVSQLSSRRSNIQGPPTAPCGQSKEERSMKEILETPVDKTENEFVLEQVEEAVITQEEELVEDLGDPEPPWEFRAEENSVKDFAGDAKEDSA